MYVLHYAPDNASLIVRLALEEAGLPYRTVLVDRRVRAQDSPAYRRLNPAGLIPALETPEGPLFETGAILLWLADRHPGAGLGGRGRRGDLLKWLFFLSNTAHADLRQVFYQHLYVTDAGRAGHRALVTERLRGHFGLVEAAASADPGLFAPPSILGLYVAALLRWAMIYPEGTAAWCDLSAYPALASLARSVEDRPGAIRVASAEGLGSRPFTDPEIPVPPEGSAT